MPKVGALCVLARNTGSTGTPVWSEVGGIRDFDPKRMWRKQEVLTRGSIVVQSVKTVRDDMATGTILRSPDDENYLAFLESGEKRHSPLDLMILDGPIDEEGVTGTRGFFNVEGDEGDQNVETVLYMNFSLSPTVVDGETTSFWRVEVGAVGVITYTPLEDYVDA